MTDEVEDDDDEDEDEEGLDDEESEGGSGGGLKKLILFVVLPVILLGGAGAGLYFSGMLDSVLGIEVGRGGRWRKSHGRRRSRLLYEPGRNSRHLERQGAEAKFFEDAR